LKIKKEKLKNSFPDYFFVTLNKKYIEHKKSEIKK
jgi:hypothetical protein